MQADLNLEVLMILKEGEYSPPEDSELHAQSPLRNVTLVSHSKKMLHRIPIDKVQRMWGQSIHSFERLFILRKLPGKKPLKIIHIIQNCCLKPQMHYLFHD